VLRTAVPSTGLYTAYALVTVDSAVPADLDVHLVVDHASTHKTSMIHRWLLLQHPRFHVHFTPTSNTSNCVSQVKEVLGPLAEDGASKVGSQLIECSNRARARSNRCRERENRARADTPQSTFPEDVAGPIVSPAARRRCGRCVAPSSADADLHRLPIE
jgi:hypothetical protein